MASLRLILAFLVAFAQVTLTKGTLDFDSSSSDRNASASAQWRFIWLMTPPVSPPISPPPPPAPVGSSHTSDSSSAEEKQPLRQRHRQRPPSLARVSTGSLLRKNVDHLTDTEILALQTHLRHLEDDHTETGFQQLVGAFHGEPSMCEDAQHHPLACCIHGMPTFVMWHRLYVVQFERALVQHGLSKIGVPYWDWTEPLHELPSLVENQIFRDPNGGIGQRNAWFSGDIEIGDRHRRTARAIDKRLFEEVPPGGKSHLFDLVLDALEEEDFCHFATQFEVAHNHIHYLVGGRHEYSMSTLEYSSYDPIFFLHHSNVDRIFVIWQELQKLRHKPWDHADCSVELFRQHMHPFDRDVNTIELTKTFSTAKDLFSHLQLGYSYEDLTLGGLNIEQLHHLLEQRHARERAFAIFSLEGLGVSANVRVHVCENEDEEEAVDFHDDDHHGEGSHHCEFAGDFFVLGGANEMPWEFVYPYHFDVTDAVQRLGMPLDGPFHVMDEVFSVNGTSLGHNLIHKPFGMHRTASGHHDPEIGDGKSSHTVVRKDVDVLTDEEMYHLRQALARFMNDTSVDGYQAVAEFHGLPAKCPHPDAAVRYACCVHGMATFPHWHRLFVVEVEDELKSRGLDIGIPYWDWTKPHTTIPHLASELTYVDPITGEALHNPFHDSQISFLGETTHREPKTELTEDPKFGDHTSLFDGMLLAFEQKDFCDFEIQFEVMHNAPHVLVGGFAPYSLTTLHYSAFDPLFYLHHSNVDRMWAIWQKLQILRGLPYKAHCASTMTQEVLKPFGFPPPWNNDEKTFDNARPTNIYDYEHVLDYTYDTLQFGGMTVDQLQHYLEERQTRDRAFVGIHLHNIGVSAWVNLTLSVPGGEPFHVGYVAVLGGEKEMPWRFERLFKVEITDALHSMGLHYDDEFEVHLDILDVDGVHWPEDTFSHNTILHHPAHLHADADHSMDEKEYVRSDVNTLSREQVQSLRDAMLHLQEDTTTHGFYQIAAFHGQPKWCPSPDAEKKYACCAHGMSVFPHWHRLLTVQAENALHENGFPDGLPYWDWTLPMTHLPDIVLNDTYEHPKTHEHVHNPLHDFTVDGHKTVRTIREDKLFQQPEFEHLTEIAEHVMLAFEQTDYCDFEIQYEIAHNYIHALVGGNEQYSMASLRYTAFDPIFYLHHSMTDRIWAIWQELQHYRGKPYNSANCAIESLRKPLQPFAQTRVVNPDAETRDHSIPFDVFDYEHSFHYHYDNFQFNGMSIPQLQREVIKRQAKERSFAGFMLHGVKESVLVVFDVCNDEHVCEHAGEFYLLGDEYEMPWRYDRLYKYDITHHLEERHIDHHDRYDIEYEVFSLDGTSLGHHLFGNSTIVYDAGHKEGAHYSRDLTASSHVRRNLADLTEGEAESLRAALKDMEEDGSFEAIAKFHGYPGLCRHEDKPAACCIHGGPTFPHWHRLYVEQVENALLNHGSAVSVPYWDWTTPIREIPHLIGDATYFDSRTQTKELNPFFRWKISSQNEYTSRDPQPELFNSNYLLDQVLLALEQTSFCDFEIQFEIMHNAIHSWLGGRGKYSMSSLDFSAFDPVFFLHHANVDRIWAIWQALQSHRHLSFEESDCALNLMHKTMHPFDDETQNLFDVTVHYSRPIDVFDYSGHLDYHYDNLKLNGWTIVQLEEVLKKQRSRDRLFAGFLLHNIGTSADVEINVCVATGGKRRSCKHPAGKFSILGGDFEMPFSFDRLYKYDISDAVRKLGLRLDSAADFDLQIRVKAVNGSYLDSRLLDKPSIIFQPGDGHHQDEHGHVERHLVRKDANTLSPAERRSLVHAMRRLQEDHSADGFQSIASFHALPPLCPHPGAGTRFACCVHGMATFPHWHRLYTVQFEDALRRHGALVGIPYLDSIQAMDELPHLMTDENYHDPLFDTDIPNPWHGAHIDFEDTDVERDLQSEKLSKKGPHGYDTWSWKQYVFALEQEDYCDFEIQFEVAHNAMHAWIGGHTIHSMSHLHYASYDPAFILHHSNTDRIFAIWQELQKHRGHDPNEINCALEMMREPLKPFSFGSPYNLNPTTTKYSKPEDTFDYHAHFNYEYDKLELQGLDVARLENYIDEQKEHDRVFAGFMLHGIGKSAHVEFSVCSEDHDCHEAGDFHVLGGSAEMPWRFDRLYKYEITDVLHEHHIDVHDPFHIEVHIIDIEGHEVNASSTFPEPSIIFEPKSRKTHLHEVAPNHIRHELSHLTERDIMSLKSAMLDLQHDKTRNGYEGLARFHGAPAMCPTPEIATHACCVHGMPTFPHWHRLYTVEMEDAMARHGSSVGLPYWDWTLPVDHLPELFTTETYYDAWRDEVRDNPFARGHVEVAHGFTVRDPQPELYKLSHDGEHSVLFDEVLLALEQTDYCDFEVQYEVLHNAIHYLVGGRQEYSLSTLEYSSYDPIFFVHHAFIDKIWVIWQELQKHRELPHDRADCAVNFMNEKLHPFDWEEFNQDVRTRAHAVPNTVFDYEDLGYHYDDMLLGGKTLEQLEELIHEHQSHHRVFAGFALHAIGTSADVVFSICTEDHECHRAGGIFILGGPLEMPWAFDRLYKYDITEALHQAHISPDDVFNHQSPFTIEVEIHAVNGTALPPSSIPRPTIIFDPAHGASEDHTTYTVAGVGVRKDVNTLTAEEVHSLRDALQHVMDGSGPISFQNLSTWHGWPGLCEHEGHKVACCHHGMVSFPQWHRLYVRALEELMTFQGARVGIPYWDWTEAFEHLPTLVTEEDHNPFHHGEVEALHKKTTRAPRPQLFNDPEHGDESFFYRQVMLAFEQRDYCDFEVQFEMAHNAIHSWVGGTSLYGMSTLEFTAYDPIFYLHHSNVDRQFAIWQALQKYRGLDYNTANCNIQQLRSPLHPFDWESNPLHVIREHARAIDAFNYDQFGYQYDNLNFHGLTIPELEEKLQKNRDQGRIFANFLLHNIGTSADVSFDLCDKDHHCNFAGTFAVLGGPLEMPFSLDRLFKYDVTSVFKQMHLRPDSEYHFEIHLTAVNGTELDTHMLEPPTVSFAPGKHHAHENGHVDKEHEDEHRSTESEDVVRTEISHLTMGQVSDLRNAMYKLQNDHGPNGYEKIASFHGAPGLCPEKAVSDRIACCQHGMAAFPHWHRLLTVQFERALKHHGAHVGIPYWDWTRPSNGLPYLFTDSSENNPFKTYHINFANHDIHRDVQDDLFRHPSEGDLESLFHQALETLEETNYCDFEVQYEILHNAVHALVGGHEEYGMATLAWSAFDPLFLVHHASIDRIWTIWQTMQKLRHKPFSFASCAGRQLQHPLEPFNFESVNTDPVTRANSMPAQVFDAEKFHYHYDNLELNGHSVKELLEMVEEMRSHDRYFAAFILHGFQKSAQVHVDLDGQHGEKIPAGNFYVLGGPEEMPWAYERPYKFDITDAVNKAGLHYGDTIHMVTRVTTYDGEVLNITIPSSLIMERHAFADHDVLVVQVGRGEAKDYKVKVKRGTHIKFHVTDDEHRTMFKELGSYTNMQLCAIPPGLTNSYEFEKDYALEPGDYFFSHPVKEECLAGKRVMITVESD